MGKPRLIIIIRHAQSEGNKNREIHQTIPDHRVKLTKDGWEQAYDAGRRLRKLLRPDDTLHFFTSPYRRTRETTEGILTTLTSADPNPSPFDRAKIKVYEEPRLREQDFGNFQPCSAEMERMWQERADYGHFFYRIPNGESAADAYDRVSGFNESLWRQFGEDDFASVCVLVTHGLMSRVFLMKWYHFTVEYFEDLRNVNHCEFLIMRKDDQSGKFILENKLRTWSELRRERALALKEKEHKEPEAKKDEAKLARSKTYVVTRRWGGCPNGCNHGSHYKRRDDIEALRDHNFDGGINGSEKGTGNGRVTNGTGALQQSTTVTSTTTTTTSAASTTTLISRRPAANKRFQSYNSDDDPNETHDHDDEDDDDHDHDHDHDGHHHNHHPHHHDHAHRHDGPHIDVSRTMDEIVSSPDGTPSFISVEDRLRGALKSPYLHVGRDFGGTYSGHASLAGSDTELSDDDAAARKKRLAAIAARVKTGGVSGGPGSVVSVTTSTTTTATATITNGTGAAGGATQPPQKVGAEIRLLDESGMGRGARANRLGDVPHSSGSSDGDGGSDGDHDGEAEAEVDEELDKMEKEERSVAESVY